MPIRRSARVYARKRGHPSRLGERDTRLRARSNRHPAIPCGDLFTLSSGLAVPSRRTRRGFAPAERIAVMNSRRCRYRTAGRSLDPIRARKRGALMRRYRVKNGSVLGDVSRESVH